MEFARARMIFSQYMYKQFGPPLGEERGYSCRAARAESLRTPTSLKRRPPRQLTPIIFPGERNPPTDVGIYVSLHPRVQSQETSTAQYFIQPEA